MCKFFRVIVVSFIALSSVICAMDNRKRICPPTPRKERPAKRVKVIANLFQAAKEGDSVLLKQFLADGSDVNVVVQEGPDKGKTPLFIAVKMGYKDIAQTLLNAGAQPNYDVKDGIDQGTNALFWATNRQDIDLIFLLLRHGAKINTCMGKGIYVHDSILDNAVGKKNVDVVYYLLKLNPAEHIVKNSLSKMHDATDNKSMMIKTMITGWCKIKQIINDNQMDEDQWLKAFEQLTLNAATKYNQMDLFFLGSGFEYMIIHLNKLKLNK